MQIKINNDRQRKQRDPVVQKQGVFATIVNEELKPAEQARIIKDQQLQQKEQEIEQQARTWTVAEIAKRISRWLHLTKP
jgi:hypothetical protein